MSSVGNKNTMTDWLLPSLC